MERMVEHIIMNIPANHTQHKKKPAVEGVLWLTDMAKSLIWPEKLAADEPVIPFVKEAAPSARPPASDWRRDKTPDGRNGTKGSAKSTNKTNPDWYCIRADRRERNTLFAAAQRQIMLLVKILHIKK